LPVVGFAMTAITQMRLSGTASGGETPTDVPGWLDNGSFQNGLFALRRGPFAPRALTKIIDRT
jgi:hypothetical protein